MAKVLTDKAVKAAATGAKRREIADGGMPGLYLVVQPTGAKSWAVRYRNSAGVPRKLTLKPAYPALGLADARVKAGEAMRAVSEGGDPAKERKAERAIVDPDRDLIENVVATFLERYTRRHAKASYAAETERLLRNEVLRRWRGRKLAEIKRSDVLELLDDIVDRGAPYTANRTLAAIRRLFNWAVERDLIAVSPCQNVKAPVPETARDRVLDNDELRLVWQAAAAMGWPFGPMVQLLILTGQRRSEVAGMEWTEVDLEKATWAIPGRRTKNGEAHTVPLSSAAMAILKGLPQIGPEARFVLTTNGSRPVSGFSRAKAALDKRILDSGAEVPPWRLHDLRRTVASGMAALGINLPAIEKVLNHTSGSFGGIVGVYQRHSYAEEKRQALEAWGRFVTDLVDDAPVANVVAMRGRA
jgi:integrase